RAVRYLLAQQNPDGGFPLTRGAQSNAQSTAWAIQGLLAAGRDPGRVRRRGSRSPLAYLRTLIAPDGSVRYSRTSSQTPVWVTAQALTALAREPLPVRGVPARGGAGSSGGGAGVALPLVLGAALAVALVAVIRGRRRLLVSRAP